MYKFALFTCATVMAYISSFGQKIVFSYAPVATAKKISKSFPYESYIVPDKNTGKMTILVKNKDEAEYLLLNKDFTVEEKLQPAGGLTSTMFNIESYRYLTGTVNNLGTCFFYFARDKSLNDGKTHVRAEVVDFKNKTVSNKMLFSFPSNETFINSFTSEGSFYIIASINSSKQLVFHIVNENGNVETKSCTIDLNGFSKLSLTEYFSDSHVFSPDQEIQLPEATGLTKFYVSPAELFIATTNLDEPPHLWRINLHNYTVTSKKLDMTGFSGFNEKKEKSYINASVFGSNLYVLDNSKNKIEIGIFDLATDKLLKKHEITEASSVPFVETPKEIRTQGRARKTNTMNSNKELIKELFKGSTGIAPALNHSGQIILTCGVYDAENRGVTMPSGHIHSFVSTRVVNFKVILDKEGSIVTSDDKQSVFDKINALIETLNDESQAQHVFSTGGKYYVSNYDPKDKTFTIQEVER